MANYSSITKGTLPNKEDNKSGSLAQRKMPAVAVLQKVAPEEELPVQKEALPEEETIQKKSNNTGLPDNLKSGVENLSGISMDDVTVHYNSSKPTQLQALAYAQGSDIHIAPGQEQHLPHEAWHVVQQKQGRVQPTMQMKEGVAVNDDKSLENEADMMGGKAMQMKIEENGNLTISNNIGQKKSYQEQDFTSINKQPEKKTKELKSITQPVHVENTMLQRKDLSVIQMKTTGVVVEMIAPAKDGMDSDQDLISEIQAKHDGLKDGLKERIFYAIGFNKRRGSRGGDLKEGATCSTKDRKYKKIDNETFGYIDNYLRWGSDTWIWPNLNRTEYKKLMTEGERPMRVNFPFRAWRALAHKTAVDHWGANEWMKKAGDRDLVYKTADSDQDWKEEELTQGLDNVSNTIGEGKGAKAIDESIGTTPLVLTTPYHWSKGKAIVAENESYKYQDFLTQLNTYETEKRLIQYNEHPLNIYYAEPTTYFTKAAADIQAVNPCSVCEGAAKISAIVDAVIHQKDKNATQKDTITSYNQIGISDWKNMFKFLHGSKITSDPGERANSLASLYNKIKVLKEGERPDAIKNGMKEIDQSAFDPNSVTYNLKKNTTLH